LAIREFRYYFNTKDAALGRRLFAKYGNWIPGFRERMKGRFSEFSGIEVKGVAIVNLHLYEPGFCDEAEYLDWAKMINTIEKEITVDLSRLDRVNQIDGLREILAIYSDLAKCSPFPQIAKMPNLLIGDLSDLNIANIAQAAIKEYEATMSFIRSKDFVYGKRTR
jgi:hypothetical protein